MADTVVSVDLLRGVGFGFAVAPVVVFFVRGVVAVFVGLVGAFGAFFAGATLSGVAPLFAFQPKRFNLPTTAFLLIPRRLPISAVDRPLPVNAFNFRNVALSQPLLILQNP